MTITWIKSADGEYNEYYCEIDAGSDGKLIFTLYSDRDELHWTLCSPNGDTIELRASDLDSAMTEASAEIKEWE